MSADDLVERCLSGDQAAWSALVDRYAGLVYAIARAHGLDEPTCDDVAQTVFSALIRRLGALREHRAIPGWLSTAAKRECWRVCGQMRRETASHERIQTTNNEPTVRLETIENVQKLREGLSELGGRCQQLLTTLYFSSDEPDYQTVSRVLGIPVGSIGPTRARCLAKLARILDPSG